MTNPLNGNFWKVVAGFEATVIAVLFVYGILRIHAVEVQVAVQIERNDKLEKSLNAIETKLDGLLLSVAAPHLVARP